MRICSEDVCTFQIPGALAAQDEVAIPMKVHDPASLRCVFAYVQQATTDGQSAYVVKISRDRGAVWEVLEKIGVARTLPEGYETTYDYLVDAGYGPPERLPGTFCCTPIRNRVPPGSLEPLPQTLYDLEPATSSERRCQ